MKKQNVKIKSKKKVRSIVFGEGKIAIDTSPLKGTITLGKLTKACKIGPINKKTKSSDIVILKFNNNESLQMLQKALTLLSSYINE